MVAKMCYIIFQASLIHISILSRKKLINLLAFLTSYVFLSRPNYIKIESYENTWIIYIDESTTKIENWEL